MKRKLLFIFILMSLCVAGITALQLYFSHSNYKASEIAFAKDTNEAMLEAIDSTKQLHRVDVARQFREWVSDTTYAKISSKWDPIKKVTVFTLWQVRYPEREGSLVLTMDQLKGNLAPITPKGRAMFLDQMEDLVRDQLKNGSVLFFTQDLGQRVNHAYFETPVSLDVFKKQYGLALKRRGIELAFTITDDRKAGDEYCTDNYNIGVRDEQWIMGCFSHTGSYLLREVKWIISGSLALIMITLVCFWYTARTLLSQQKLSRLKDDFISNMTHEIHTPLTSITVTAEALKKFSHNQKERQSYIDIILHQSRKLAVLTDEILTGARLEKEGLEMNDSIEVNQLLEDTLADFTHERDRLKLNYCPQSVTLKGNKLHLHNTIANLVDNALKYNTSPDPVVTIACSVGKNLKVTVSDNGPGISDADKKKVFDQFYRIPSGNVHDVKGYGLGLSYVKKVVGAHNGNITIEDNQPEGANFIITLPL